MNAAIKLEYAGRRKIRERNKFHYRVAHWPIWIWVFFLVPGPQTFRLFAYGFDSQMSVWLGAVLVATAIAGLFGRLPGVEPRPYIIRFTEDKPNPLYRRICYTVAWSELIAFTALNLAGLVHAVLTEQWKLKQIYDSAFLPVAGACWVLGAFGRLPRVKQSTQGEGDERRYFYGMVWAALCGHGVLGALWITLPRAFWADCLMLMVFAGVLMFLGYLSYGGHLPRTRKIVPGELAVSD